MDYLIAVLNLAAIIISACAICIAVRQDMD